MNEPVLLEALSESMLAECVGVIRAAFQTVADDFGFTEAQVPTNAAFLTLDRLRAAQTRGDRIWALRVAERTVGSVSMRPPAAVSSETVSLKRLAVAPPFRHRGYGATLLECSCAIAAATGATAVSVGIIDANTVLRRWYEQHGFTVAGRQDYDQLPFTVCYLRRPLGV